MEKLSYETAEVLIYDPVTAHCLGTRASLYGLGFRAITSVSTLEAFFEEIAKRSPDIAFIEVPNDCKEFSSRIQMLRQGFGIYNPFLVIILTSWVSDCALVTSAIDSGADDLIIRPFSTATLAQRIEQHIERRKHFVITSGYAGPDRRSDAERNSSADKFDPPNSLRLKAKDRLSTQALMKQLGESLAEARSRLQRETLRRESFHICVLWWMISRGDSGDRELAEGLDKLVTVATSILRHTENLENPEARHLSACLLAAAANVKAGGYGDAALQLLGQASLDLHELLHPEQARDSLAEIEATGALLRARKGPVVSKTLDPADKTADSNQFRSS